MRHRLAPIARLVALGLLGIVLCMVGGVAVAGSVPLTGQARCTPSPPQSTSGGTVRSGSGSRTWPCPRVGDCTEPAGTVLDPPEAALPSGAPPAAPLGRCESAQENALAAGARPSGDLPHGRAPPTGTW